MPNFRLIGAAVKPAIRHEQTDKQTNKQTDRGYLYIYIDIYMSPHRTNGRKFLFCEIRLGEKLVRFLDSVLKVCECMSVCLFVCLSVCLSSKNSQNQRYLEYLFYTIMFVSYFLRAVVKLVEFGVQLFFLKSKKRILDMFPSKYQWRSTSGHHSALWTGWGGGHNVK